MPNRPLNAIFAGEAIDEDMPIAYRVARIAKGEGLEALMKERHLTKNERDLFHKPLNDWHDSKKGDVLKSASSLEVEDIIRKHIK